MTPSLLEIFRKLIRFGTAIRPLAQLGLPVQKKVDEKAVWELFSFLFWILKTD